MKGFFFFKQNLETYGIIIPLLLMQYYCYKYSSWLILEHLLDAQHCAKTLHSLLHSTLTSTCKVRITVTQILQIRKLVVGKVM